MSGFVGIWSVQGWRPDAGARPTRIPEETMCAPHRRRGGTSPLLVVPFAALGAALAACGDASAESPAEPRRAPSSALAGSIAGQPEVGPPVGPPSATSLSLPYNVSASTPLGGLFDITQQGAGGGGAFRVSNPNSGAPALFAGSAGTFTLNAFSYGAGSAVYALALGTGRAAIIDITYAGNGTDALLTRTAGTGSALVADQRGPTGPIALFQSSGVNKIRFDKTGRGFFNGSIQVGGADVAETFAVEGRAGDYGPGDVLVVSARSDRRVERSGGAYSTRVVGVYATRPGVVLTEHGIDDALDTMVPLGVIGVIPTKVSAENGRIRRGDLLVTARTRGHAMRGTDRGRLVGAVIGRALQEFAGPGTGVIQVLVNVR
jgi:hypothetical protein